MIDRPSSCFTHEELCDEFDWLFEFQSRMAEHIKDDPDVHNMVDYVNKLEHENAELREELAKWERLTAGIDLPEYPVTQFVPKDIERENTKLRELARHLYACLSYCDRNDDKRGCGHCPYRSVGEDCEFEMRLLELGVEVY